MKKLDKITPSKNFKDLTGKKIKNWIVLKRTQFVKRRDPVWECQCVCGKIKLVCGNSLRNGSGSCGCKHDRTWRKGKYKDPRYTTIRNIMARYNYDANRRNITFDLNFNDFKKFILDKCFYCNKIGTSYQKTYTGRNVRYNGIDRVDNTKGYIKENCVTCCKSCNTKKKSITPDMIKKAYEFLFR